jgi:hypothetical protein
VGTNGFISRVETGYGQIQIIRNRSTGIPATGTENQYIPWTASPTGNETTRLDFLVIILADEDNWDIGSPEGFPFIADLNDQRDYIQDYYSADNPLWTEENPNPHPAWANWDNISAPGGEWSNYLQESYVPNLSEYKRRVNGSYTWDDLWFISFPTL